ncbi:hypothetical protein CaCOL14_004658 [Colletotrichum acutatum]
MGDIKSVLVSISAVSEISERKRTFSSLSTGTTSSLAAPKTRQPPRVTSTEKVRELVRLAITRLRVLLNENKGTRRPISQKGLFSYNYVEPLFNWWGANYRVLTTQCLGRVEASDALGSVTKLVNGASHNYAGFYKATSQAEELQRLCLEALPVSDTRAVPLLRNETHHAIADFFGADFCFTTSTGYGSNYIALPALIDCSTMVIMDENCHNSMFTGAFLASSPNLRKFKHNNMEHLEILLSGCIDESVNVIVAIEGLYRFVKVILYLSMEADIPPLDLLHHLKKDYDFTLYCDEAHSFLSLGKTGRGCLEYWNNHHPESPLPWDLIDIRTGTLSKAIGGIGGIIVGRAVFQDIIRERIEGLNDQDNVSLPSSTMIQTLWVLDEEVNRLLHAVIRAAASVGMGRMRKISRSFFKTKVEVFDAEEDCNEASKVFDWVRSLIKMDAAMGPHSDQRQLFDSTCGPRILDIGHGSRAQYGIGAGGARWICGTFPPHLVVEDLIARATGMEAALTYADASIGLASTIAALSRPLVGHTKHFMLFERGASQFVRDGLAMASKKDAPTLLGYVDLFQLVQQVRKLYRRNTKLCLTVYVRVGEDSAHHLLSSILEEIAAITGPESVMTILLHCTSQYLDPRQLISFPSRMNIHVLVCGSFNRIFGLPAGFLTGPQSLIRELRYTSRGYMFTTSPPPFIMDMLRGALEWNLASD